ncbi:LppU/SCO3897 family protein [Streptomyces rimosus]|uniref:LppU/SCO3897 family protein n=1 Tax=Streptomyces rimosus TaxID=1927 RepID=UPI003787D967
MSTPPPPQNGGYPPYGHPAQPPQGPPPQGQAPYGQAPYGQQPYPQAPYPQAPYPQAPYAQAPQAPQAPYGQAPNGGPGGRPPRQVRIPGIVRALIVLLIFGGIGAWVVMHQDEYNAESRKRPKADPQSVTAAKVGDCLQQTGGTDKEPELKIIDCGNAAAKYKVAKVGAGTGCEPGQADYRRFDKYDREVMSLCMTHVDGNR